MEYEENISFQSYDNEGCFTPVADVEEESLLENLSVPTSEPEPWTEKPRRDRLLCKDPAGDDNSIEREPTRHVDYLSHEWKLEEIWSSWSYVVARRRVYSNSVRLENAAWRTWAKSMNRLKTISPESLNW